MSEKVRYIIVSVRLIISRRILDSGSSRHLVSDESWLDNVGFCQLTGLRPYGIPLNVSEKGSVTMMVNGGWY